ncbi:hypothetical protein [Spirosoma arcticum]
MKGITYLRDEQDRLKAVQIDAELHKDALQDFLDGLEAEQLKQEPKKKFDEVAQRILSKKNRADV